MVSTKKHPGEFDGMERALDDEPVFTLRAHDVLAYRLVIFWVKLKRRLILRSDMPTEKQRKELIQCREAEEIAFAMKEWRAGTIPVKPKEDRPVRPTYSGIPDDPAEVEAKKRWQTIKNAATRLNNSIAEISTAIEDLEPYGWSEERDALTLQLEQLKLIAEQIRPKKIGYAITEDDRLRAAQQEIDFSDTPTAAIIQ